MLAHVETCPSEEQLTALLTGELPTEQRPELERHLDRCEDCRVLVAAAAATTPPCSGPRTLHAADEELIADASTALEGPTSMRRGVRIANRYSVEAAIGVGAMGMVFRARDERLGRAVALKVLRLDRFKGSATELERARRHLEREARHLARLSHPHVTAAYDVGEHGGDLFVVMELVEGRDLRAWLTDEAPAPEAIVEAFRQAALGLLAAHTAGLVHRDFKPENVLIARDGAVRVSDFGLARLLDDAADDTGTHAPAAPAGTLRYMAPEVLDGAGADAASDQFSFCVALWEAYTGAHPFEARTGEELRRALARGPTRGGPRRLPSWLRRVLERGLRLERSARHPSMASLARALHGDTRRRALRRAAAGAVASLAALALAVTSTAAPPSRHCASADAVLAGVWNRDVVAGLERRAESFGPEASAAWRAVRGANDAFVTRWTEAYEAACAGADVPEPEAREAARQSVSCLLGQVAVLERSRAHLEAADGAGLAFLAAQPTRLDRPSACLAATGPQADTAPSEAHAKVAAYGLEVNRLLQQGSLAEAESAALAAKAVSDGLDEPGLTVDVAMLLGNVALMRVQLDAARAAYESALLAAPGLPGSEPVRTAFYAHLGVAAADAAQGDLARATESLASAEAQLERWPGAPDEARAVLASRKATVLGEQGHHAAALREGQLALTLRQASTGDTELAVAGTLVSVADSERELGDLAAATAHLTRALEIRERRQGPRHTRLAGTLVLMARVQAALGHSEDAKPLFERAYEIRAAHPEEPVELAFAELALAEWALRAGSLEVGLARAEAAERRLTDALGAGHAHSLFARALRARLAAEQGRCRDATALLDGALAPLEPRITPRRRAPLLELRAETLLRCGAPEDAATLFTAALDALAEQELSPAARVRARLGLAAALTRAPGGPPRARALRGQALAEALESRQPPLIAEARAAVSTADPRVGGVH